MIRSLRALFRLLDAGARRRAGAIVALAALASFLEVVGLSVVPVLATAVAYPGALDARLPDALAALLADLPRPRIAVLVTLTGALTLLFAAKAAIATLLAHRSGRFLRDVRVDLGDRLFERYLSMPLADAVERRAPELVRDLTSELQLTVNQALRPALEIAAQAPMAIAIVGLVVIVSPPIALAVLIAFCLAQAVLFAFVSRRLVRVAGQAQSARERVIDAAQEAFSSAREVRVYARQDAIRRRVARDLGAQGSLLRETLLYQALQTSGTELLGVLLILLTLTALVFTGAPAETLLATLSFFAFALIRLRTVFQRIYASLGTLRQGVVAVDALCRALGAMPATGSTGRERTGDTGRIDFGTIRLGNVAHHYAHADRPSLSGVDLEIRRGEFVGIMGPSGSGKSTLLDILMGLVEPDSGRAELDGRPLMTRAAAWHRGIGFVPQRVHLLDATIGFNITYEDVPSDPDRLRACIDAAGLSTFVAGLAAGLLTPLGPNATRLSGGERQRIAIARALYRSPEVLVLDEATAALDEDAERAIMAAIIDLCPGITLIAASHRPSALEHADRVLRLVDGRLLDAAPALHVEPGRPR